MIRRAFTLQLQPGALERYVDYHANIWPDLVEEIERCGIGTMTAFATDPVVFYYSEIRDPDSWDRLWSTPIHDKWGELFKPLIAFNAEGKVDAGDLQEIFRLETSKQDSAKRRAFSLRLEPGALAEYQDKHDNIWPEMVAEIGRLGIARMTAFAADPVIFYYSEVLHDGAWDALWASEVHDRWAGMFKSLIAFNEDEQVDAQFMTEIFHLETAA